VGGAVDARSKSLTGRELKPTAPADSSWADRASPTTAADRVGRHVALVWAVACGEPAGRW